MSARLLFRAISLAAALAGALSCSDSSAPDVTPKAIAITSSSGTLISGRTANLVAVITNASGGTIPNATLEWTSSDPTVASVTKDGMVTGLLVGTSQISASIGTIHSLGVSITVTPGAAAQLGIRTQPGGGPAGIPLTTEPVIEIRDAAGNLVPASGIAITATVATGGGALSGSSVTSTDGVATFIALTLTGSVGDRTLSFSAAGLSPVTSAGFPLTAGLATRLGIRTQPAGATSGQPLTAQPQVEVRDDWGNVVTTSTAVVTASMATGSGKLTNGSATAVGGVATFSGLSISGTVGGHSLVFNAPSLSPAASASFNLAAGAAAQLRLRTAPAVASFGQVIVPAPVVEVDDDAGNVVDAHITITATIASGGGTLTGDKAVSDTGVATFPALAITGVLGPHTLTFTAPGLAPTTSPAFSLTSGGATKLAIKVHPLDAVSGRPLQQQPVIEVRDDQDNVVASYVGTVTAANNDQTVLVSGNTATILNGVATFTALTLTGANAVAQLSFTSGALLPAKAFPITILPGGGGGGGGPPVPVASLVVLVAPSLFSPNGVPLPVQPVIEALDSHGMPILTPVVISIGTDAISGTITNGSATTVSGIATFHGLTLSGPLGARNYIFSAGGASTGIFRITITP